MYCFDDENSDIVLAFNIQSNRAEKAHQYMIAEGGSIKKQQINKKWPKLESYAIYRFMKKDTLKK